MSDKIEYSRLKVKRTDVPAELPTIPTGSTLSSFVSTDIYVGEFFLNTNDDRLFIRTDNGIVELLLTGGTPSVYTQNLAQTLLIGNQTLSNNIVMSQDDKITSFSGGSYIKMNKIVDEIVDLYASQTGVGISNILVAPLDLTIQHSLSANTGSITLDATDIEILFTDTIDTSTINVSKDTIIMNTLNLIINNLPTSSSGLTSNQLFTQTATELGGTGTTKVICIV